ncbi:DNA/RNA non-specific endonuclease [Planococcus chinensis]|uniref:DNA/RNA non-specific endonuclease n=1 Tax=Planococcus chinensis TaxID=272917 RepID=A0ABW4QHH6_9BACL
MNVLFIILLLLALLAFAASIVMLLVSALFKKGLTVKQAGLAAGVSFAVIIGSTIGVGSTADEVQTAADVESEQMEAQKEKAEEQRLAQEEAEKQAALEKEKEEARLALEKEAAEKAAAEKLANEKAAAEKAKAEALAKEKAAQELAEKEKAAAQQKNELFAGYSLIEVDGGDLSGTRKANIVVDIGFGDREYWAFTNEHGQLVRVVAEEIIVQDDNSEPVTSEGRYYADEAKVPGVESDILDEGHVIADSLGGVSNAYNITPQESTLNRHGDQAYMEDVIRDAGGATDFEAIITYPDTDTQVPSHYQYTYTVMGNEVVDTFDNVNPDEVNASLGLTGSEPASLPAESAPAEAAPANTGGDVSSVDTNGNGQVTIKEAKDAGFPMPITSDHWLYQYMDDRDGDGMVGE